MKINENIKIALSSLSANKLRSALTMLGIIIGIASVIAIVTVGNSISASVNQSINEMMGNKLSISCYSEDDGEEVSISYDMISEYKEKFSSYIQGVSLDSEITTMMISNGQKKVYTTISGSNEDYAKIEKYHIEAGRLLRSKDITDVKHVCLVSKQFVQRYYGNKHYDNAISKVIDIDIEGNIHHFTIVGVYSTPNDSYLTSEDPANIKIPITCAFKLYNCNDKFSYFDIKPNDDIDMDTFEINTQAFFKSYFKSNPSATIYAYSNVEYQKQMNETMNKLKVGIGAIAAISLLVGGIGVMNIMMVTVVERTREIGIRLALGAKQKQIMGQFIIEAIIICLIGGLIGVALGEVIGNVIAKMMGYPLSASISSILIAVLFSCTIGVFFGYYPAKKASNLNPIDALGYE